MTNSPSSAAPQPQPAPAGASPDAATLQNALASGAAFTLPVIEEQAIVQREVVEAGRVRITRQVHEADELVRVALQHDEVRVERVPVNQYLPVGAAAPAARYEGEVMIIPVLREVAVVEKRLLVVEELRVTKQQITTEHAEPMHLRREDISVERLPGISSGGNAAGTGGPAGGQAAGPAAQPTAPVS
jgi:uncharacterized protein (TIGR02271 family)